MTYLPELLAVAAVWAVVVVSPGPDFVAVVHHSTARSRREALFVGVGIATATAIWSNGSLLGLAVVFARFGWLVTTVKLLGAAYLVYLGITVIRRAHRPPRSTDAGRRPAQRPLAAYRVGFLTDLANPKAAVFFSSLFAVVLPAGAPGWLQASAVAVIVGIAWGWYSAVAVVFSFAPVRAGYRRVRRWVDYATGGVLVSLGARLAAGSR